jgi:integrase
VLEPIWHKTPETLLQVGRVGKQMLEVAFPLERNGQRHHPALPYKDVAAFLTELRGNAFVSARALEFTILTAARTSEVINAMWDEIDFDAKLWTVPATRMKAKGEHRVPLCQRALELLAALPRENERFGRFQPIEACGVPFLVRLNASLNTRLDFLSENLGLGA